MHDLNSLLPEPSPPLDPGRLTATPSDSTADLTLDLTTDLTSNLQHHLETKNYRDALKQLNQMGSSRFTAIFAFEKSQLHNALLYDREQPDIERLEQSKPVDESYCIFVKNSHKTFIVTDSLTDPRVNGHAKQPIYRSYCGVPIHNQDGSLWGTLCYFDTEPNRITSDMISQLGQVAQVLKNGIPY